MNLQFVKMHSLGNDFMMIDAIRQKVSLSSEMITRLSDRHQGVGFDQCILVEASKKEGIDFFYRIFNANGQEVGQCGNGARCLAHFIHYTGLSDKKRLTVETLTTQMCLQVSDGKDVVVEMAKPQWQAEAIPFLGVLKERSQFSLTLDDGCIYPIRLINVGNPHAVLDVEELDSLSIDEVGKQISKHRLFPEQTNVGFMQRIDSRHIQLRVYERGCGETYACGSGAVAAAAIGRLYWDLAPQVTVRLPGGELKVTWPDMNGPIYLQGPSTLVYEAKLNSDFVGL